MDDDKDRRRKSIFDIIDELMRDINRMMKDLMEEGYREGDPTTIKGFSIYMGPEGIDIRDLSGKPIHLEKSFEGFNKDSLREFLRLDYDIIEEDDKKIVYIDLRRVPSGEIKVDKEDFIIHIKYNDKIYSVTLPKDLGKYSIESYEVKNGVLKVVLKKKNRLFGI